MKNFHLYSHDGSENHGCEALVKTTIQVLKSFNKSFQLVSAAPEQDKYYGLDKFCSIIKRGTTSNFSKFSFDFLKAYISLKFKHDYSEMDILSEIHALNIQQGDIALSIGGDTYCYGWTKDLAHANRIFKKAGAKTVYWGCSIEPELLNNKDIAYDISQFDLITARESISYDALKKINNNTILVSDSAFLLPQSDVKLQKGFSNCDLIGINLSPLVVKCNKQPDLVIKNYVSLIEYILNYTNMKILLIPHVNWARSNDNEMHTYLSNIFNYSNRLLQIEDANCETLKGYISKCRFFIGARTHATIAAYSTYVPTIAVGYSVKSVGIARDLFGSDKHFVVSAQDMKTNEDLTNSFKWLQQHENEVKCTLINSIPEYSKRVYKAVTEIERFIK